MPLQVLANALISAAGYALVGLSFGLIYRTARFFHFSHGAVYTIGAYAALSVSIRLGWWWLAVPAASLVSAFIGWGLFRMVYAPIQRRGVSATILLVASLGLFVVLQNMISIIYGDEMHALGKVAPGEGVMVWGARITWVQSLSVLCSVVLCAALWFLLRFTQAGLLLRAVADDKELCRAMGVRVERIVGQSFLIGSAMAGAAGALLAYDTHLFPTMGFRALLMAVTAVVVGGMGSMPGTAMAAVFVATAQHLGAWYFSAKWQDAIAFLILVLFLLLRPQGFLGKPLRRAAV